MKTEHLLLIACLSACLAGSETEDENFDRINSGQRRALLLPEATVEGNWGVASANEAARFLRSNNWATVTRTHSSWDAVFRELDGYIARGEKFDLIVTLSHAGWDGPVFSNQLPWATATGDESDVSEVSNTATLLLAERFRKLVPADGTIMFSGCNTAGSTARDSDSTELTDKKGTRYRSFSDAIANMANRRVLGTSNTTNLGDTASFLRGFYYGSGLQSNWRRVEAGQGMLSIVNDEATAMASGRRLRDSDRGLSTCGLGAASECNPDAAPGDGCCDPCLGDDPDCTAPAESCPEIWRDDEMDVCDECLGDDPDCLMSYPSDY